MSHQLNSLFQSGHRADTSSFWVVQHRCEDRQTHIHAHTHTQIKLLYDTVVHTVSQETFLNGLKSMMHWILDAIQSSRACLQWTRGKPSNYVDPTLALSQPCRRLDRPPFALQLMTIHQPHTHTSAHIDNICVHTHRDKQIQSQKGASIRYLQA